MKSTLRNHYKVVCKGKRFNCDQCNFQSTSTGHLKDHMVVTHYNLRFSYKCDKCNFKAVTGLLVKKHVKRVHLLLKLVKIVKLIFAHGPVICHLIMLARSKIHRLRVRDILEIHKNKENEKDAIFYIHWFSYTV